MLSAFGQQRFAREHKRIMEHMRENERRVALGLCPEGDVGTVFGFTLDQLVHMLQALAEHVDPKLQSKHPKEIYSTIRHAVQKEEEPGPKTKEELAEHLYYLSMKKQGSVCCPDWEHNKSVHKYWLDKANEMIVKSWEESQ